MAKQLATPPSLRERFISASKAPSPLAEKVEIPEWEMTVLINPMKVRERMGIAKDPERDTLQRVIALSMTEPDGTRMFDADSPADLDALSEVPMAILERLGKVAMRVNGLTPESLDAIEKN